MLTSRNFDEVQREYFDQLRTAPRRSRRSGRSGRNRRNRNQPTDNGARGNAESADGNNNSNADLINNNVRNGLQVINEENEGAVRNLGDGDASSTAPLIASESSDTDSADSELDTEAFMDDNAARRGQGEGHEMEEISERDRHGDDDVENILRSESLSAQWERGRENIDDEDGDDDDDDDEDVSSDDECILNNPCFHSSRQHDLNQGQGQNCDNASIDTEASASIASIENQLEIVNERDESKENSSDDSNDSDCDLDDQGHDLDPRGQRRNRTPKPDPVNLSSVITMAGGSRLSRGQSQTSLNSTGSETMSENDVPMHALTSTLAQQ